MEDGYKLWDELLKTVGVLTAWPLVVLYLALLFRQALTRQIPIFFKSLENLMIETPPPVAPPSGSTAEQQQIVLALSGSEYEWRSLRRLAAVTGLEKNVLDLALTQLLKKNIVKPAFGRRSIVFGLRERVDKK